MTPKKTRSGKHLNAGVLVRAPDAEREAWARCAEREGLTRQEWLRRLANREVSGRGMLSGIQPSGWVFADGNRLSGPRTKKVRAKKG